MRTPWSCASALALAGCAVSTPFVETAEPCDRPVQIPVAGVSDRQVEILWARDRAALLDCGDTVETLSGRKPGGG
ncbi:hypothetical protein GCM10010973_30340 [Cribrihabitans marinus]|nr:hypothetical protein GCM10010973_30340 [Cribrihabitans marinus]